MLPDLHAHGGRDRELLYLRRQPPEGNRGRHRHSLRYRRAAPVRGDPDPEGRRYAHDAGLRGIDVDLRSEEHTSELQSLMRISYAVFCLKKKTKNKQHNSTTRHDPNQPDIKHKKKK